MLTLALWFWAVVGLLWSAVLFSVVLWLALRLRRSRPRRGGYVKLAASTATNRSTGTRGSTGAAGLRSIMAGCRSTWGRGTASHPPDSPLIRRVRPWLNNSPSPTASGLRMVDAGAAVSGPTQPPRAA